MTVNDARDKFRPQFTLSTAFWGLTAIAILCAVARWERAFPYWTVVPAAILVLACVIARRNRLPDLAWGLISIAWLITLIDVTNSLIKSFGILGGPPPAHEMQTRFWHAYGAAVALPAFLTFPAVYWAAKASVGSSSRARKWLIAGPMIALADSTLVTGFLVILIGYAWNLLSTAR